MNIDDLKKMVQGREHTSKKKNTVFYCKMHLMKKSLRQMRKTNGLACVKLTSMQRHDINKNILLKQTIKKFYSFTLILLCISLQDYNGYSMIHNKVIYKLKPKKKSIFLLTQGISVVYVRPHGVVMRRQCVAAAEQRRLIIWRLMSFQCEND
ncbi:hypothetical protein BDA99DRAFT_538437 [Phascolomyces articulosus]|uniref:Uncharacterized protein n=1 Tax=Phascolomyces articulosus TaxID=60185 RepID=A0AAD5PD32_9FUNG|nr:hypothetical protein BDA99DRAFT_538437 [Phascolomyces articulosus]